MRDLDRKDLPQQWKIANVILVTIGDEETLDSTAPGSPKIRRGATLLPSTAIELHDVAVVGEHVDALAVAHVKKFDLHGALILVVLGRHDTRTILLRTTARDGEYRPDEAIAGHDGGEPSNQVHHSAHE
jgi:hypothetical protein